MVAGEENEDVVDAVARELLAAATPEQRRALALSMQPVYIAHDEYLFIRVLESYEVTFAAMAAQIRDAIDAVWTGRAEDAADSVRKCADLLGSARRLFTLLATMQVESFRDFRTYTVGASAIQSGNYKTFEALCSPPVRSRMESPAYDAVPQIRDRIQNDWIDLTTAVVSATGDGRIDAAGLAVIRSAATELEDVHQRWKQTHWKLAIRMIGEEKGTGYTVGVPYLKGVIDNRLFAQLTGGSHAG
jgi:tryptophan 2,3-dioxygenase